MSRGIHHVHRARRTYPCDGEGYPYGCDGPIGRGDLYVRSALPPDDPEVGNVGWWVLRYCTRCARAYDGPERALLDYLNQTNETESA